MKKKISQEEFEKDEIIEDIGEEAEGEVVQLKTTLAFRYKLIIFISVVVIVVAALYILLETKFKIKNFNVVGNTWYSEQEIKNSLSTEFYDGYSIFFKLHYMLKDTPQMAFIDKYSIKLEKSDTVQIRVYEKNIVGCVKEMGEYFYFDKDGFVVASRSERENNVPQIDGLKYTSSRIDAYLDVGSDKIFSTILEVTQLIDKYEIEVDRILFDDDLSITLYCSNGNQAYLGVQSNYDVALSALPKILEGAEKKNSKYWMDLSTFSAESTTFMAEFLDENGNRVQTGIFEDGGDDEGENDGDDDGEDDTPEDDVVVPGV